MLNFEDDKHGEEINSDTFRVVMINKMICSDAEIFPYRPIFGIGVMMLPQR